MTGRSVSAAGPSLHGLVLAEKSDKSKFQIPLLPFTEHVRIYNYNLTIIYIYMISFCSVYMKWFELILYKTHIMFYHIFSWSEIHQASKTWTDSPNFGIGVSRNSDLLDLDRVMMAPRLVDEIWPFGFWHRWMVELFSIVQHPQIWRSRDQLEHRALLLF